MSVPYLGKRNPGGLTAAAPGDTLFFPFGSYNDSGDSEGVGGTFAVTDIEVFKNGLPTTRATDSGYSLISDTGQVGDRVGLHRFSIQLFNTSDDTGHYESGAWYQVAVDAVTIDGKTVRFWAGQFEIGHQRVDVRQIAGDTGAAIHLQQAAAANQRLLADVRAVLNDTGAAHLDQGRYGVLSDSGRQAAVLDTGKVAAAVWTSHATRALTAFAFDTGIWGSNFAGGRTLTSFLFDTGVAQTVWRSSPSAFTGDTGSAGYAQGRLMAVKGDTGAAHLEGGRLGVTADLQRVDGDTGAATRFFRFLEKLDTGGDIVVSAAVDTGLVNNAVWNGLRSAHTDTGTFGEHLGGSLGQAVVDTGVVNQAVWGADASRTLTSFQFDTGVTQGVWRASPSAFTSDTGSAGYAQGRIMAVRNDTGAAHLDQGRFGVISDSGRQAAVLDTGKVAAAVWTSHATRALTAFAHDTGVAQTVWRSSTSGFTSDTGSVGYAQGRLMAVKGDTGAAHLDQGRLGVISDSGRMAAVLDTGKVAGAVWTSHQTRALTAFAFDTGIWGSNFAGGRTLTSFGFDTGIWASPSRTLTAMNDTGVIERLTAIEERTGRLQFDTGNWVRADVHKVNNVEVIGAGDTGTGNTWRAGP